MQTLQELISQKKSENLFKKEFNSQRAELFSQLYQIYELDFKKQTWKNYLKWLKEKRFKHSKEKVQEYKKIMYKKITVASFCSFWLSHIPTEDLYYLLSIAKDMQNRNQSFNKWLFYNLKVLQDK